jgi:hypothetical protein
VALQKREGILNLPSAGTVHRARSDRDPAVENLARQSHFPVGDVKQLYVDEIAKLTKGAHVKNFLAIFALRHVHKILLNRSVTKRALVKPDDNPETGHPVLPSDAPLP